jgi:hypothetical protein
MRKTMNEFADWQWNVNAWSKQDNPAAAIQHYLAGQKAHMPAHTDRAFAWLCYGQRHDHEALAAYRSFRAEHGDDLLLAAVLKAHGARTAELTEATVHLEWQAHSNPRSLLAAVTAWQATTSGGEPTEAMFELLAGQQHNANACQLYRASFDLHPTELFEAASDYVTRLAAGGLSHPYLLGTRPSATVLRDQVPTDVPQATEPA